MEKLKLEMVFIRDNSTGLSFVVEKTRWTRSLDSSIIGGLAF